MKIWSGRAKDLSKNWMVAHPIILVFLTLEGRDRGIKNSRPVFDTLGFEASLSYMSLDFNPLLYFPQTKDPRAQTPV